MTTYPIEHDQSKHLAIDYHFVQELVSHGDLIARFFPTGSQIADTFTREFLLNNFYI